MPKGNWLCPGVGREKVLEQSLETLQSLVRHPSIMGIGVGELAMLPSERSSGLQGSETKDSKDSQHGSTCSCAPFIFCLILCTLFTL